MTAHLLLPLLRWILKTLARATVARYRPGIIGITGSVGKTSAKRAVAAVLGSDRRVRVGSGNFNNELGVPLTVISDATEIRGALFWPRVIVKALWNLAVGTTYPEILVLEYGADKPGDIKYLLEIVRPNISIITAIGDIPVHVEFYSGPDEVAREKARLIECLPAAGLAILNHDDESVMNVKDHTRAHIVTFGFGRGAEIGISSFEHRVEHGRPWGVSFKLDYGGSVVPVRLHGVFGRVQAYAAAAAAAVGTVFGMNLVKIADALQEYRPASGRLEIAPGINNSWILNDSYNASPASMHAALDTLRDLPGRRKMAVVGDMLELGKYATAAHEGIGRLAGKFADALVTIGPRAKFIAEGARAAGMSGKSIQSFDSADEAALAVVESIRRGDLVLVKASRAMHLERVVEAIRSPETVEKPRAPE